MKLPQQLLPYTEDLEKTKRPSLIIRGKIQITAPLESKFGWQPYWLKADEYPTDENGEPLRLLAQINFSEMKESILDFPRKGILQFFVADDDLFYGLNFDDMTKQDTFRVVYHETIETDSSKWMTEFPPFENGFPVGKECALSFEVSEEIVSANDYRFNKLTMLDALWEDAKDDDYDAYDDILEVYYEALRGQGSKLGGYPFFTQEDPSADGDYPT